MKLLMQGGTGLTPYKFSASEVIGRSEDTIVYKAVSKVDGKSYALKKSVSCGLGETFLKTSTSDARAAATCKA
eukprot:TRINITY_DN2239_c0_g1_i1.p3 TRINITY_DN2239_c0_g1~~TRINITY_DN2239_c0_g1_i1.p3  ORF type:complete len:73 (-),score=14.74 TRINITY_DN2239_c0_g1_i1:135-353(-)